MTSTNDEKDVKSIQTSGPKGKTYYIELYKSLESALSRAVPLSERSEALCSAWGRVHQLSLHSAPDTHPHLLLWIQRHTARTILQTKWQNPESAEHRNCLDNALADFLEEVRVAADARDGVAIDWETKLVERAEWFRRMLPEPWGHPVLRKLIDSNGPQPSHQEVLEWLREERGQMFASRLRQLGATSTCHDLALALVSAVMERVRATSILDDRPPGAKANGEAPKEASYRAILTKEADFTPEVWDLLVDLEFVLLYKVGRTSRCIELAKQTPIRTGSNLVERLRKRIEISPRDKKLWKNGRDVAIIIAEVIVTRCMVTPVCSEAIDLALHRCTKSLVRLLPAAKLPAVAATLAAPAAMARHLYTFAHATHTQCTEMKLEMKPFVCQLYVRAINAAVNDLERLRLDAEKEAEARAMEQTLAAWFVKLGDLLAGSERIRCECALTAFSVHPSPAMFDRLRDAPPLQPAVDKQEPLDEPRSEFGSWASDSHGQSNFVKTSETLKLARTGRQTNVLSTAFLTAGEALGLSAELCQDVAALLSGSRLKTLSWDMDRENLLEVCRGHMERTDCGTRTVTTELRYLNLDPEDYPHLPEEYDGEGDRYYGIERGYEHLVVFESEPEPEPEPEAIWADAMFDSEQTASADSSALEQDDAPVRHRKKKNRSRKSDFLSDEADPLSLPGERADRQPSKERQTDKKEKAKRGDDRSKSKTKKKRETSQERRKEMKAQKKREKKERKKLSQDDVTPKPLTSLSSLIGLKVCASEDLQLDFNTEKSLQKEKKKKTPIDGVRLSSESDSQVVYDGQFSMDELKTVSPQKPQYQPDADTQYSVESRSPGVGVSSQLFPSIPPYPRAQSAANSPFRENVKKQITKLLAYRRQRHALPGPSPSRSFAHESPNAPRDHDNSSSSGGSLTGPVQSYLQRNPQMQALPAPNVTAPAAGVNVPPRTLPTNGTITHTDLVNQRVITTNVPSRSLLINSAIPPHTDLTKQRATTTNAPPRSLPTNSAIPHTDLVNLRVNHGSYLPATATSECQADDASTSNNANNVVIKLKPKQIPANPKPRQKKPPAIKQTTPKGIVQANIGGEITSRATNVQPGQKVVFLQGTIDEFSPSMTKVSPNVYNVAPNVTNMALNATNVVPPKPPPSTSTGNPSRKIHGMEDFLSITRSEYSKRQAPNLTGAAVNQIANYEKDVEQTQKTYGIDDILTLLKTAPPKVPQGCNVARVVLNMPVEEDVNEKFLKRHQQDAPMTFSRMMYDKTSKQKQKQTAEQEAISNELEKHIIEFQKLKALQTKGTLTVAKVDAKPQQQSSPSPSKANPILASFITAPSPVKTQPTPPRPTVPLRSTHLDQKEMLSLLQQQNNLVAGNYAQPHIAHTSQYQNAPQVTVNKAANATETGYTNDSQSAMVTAQATRVGASDGFQNEFNKMLSEVEFMSNNKVYLELDEEPANAPRSFQSDFYENDDLVPKTKGKSKKCPKKGTQIQKDLVNVMDALLAHKTPSRGPNALELTLTNNQLKKKERVNKKPKQPKKNTITVDKGQVTQDAKLTVAAPKLVVVSEKKAVNPPNTYDLNRLIETEVAYHMNAKNYKIPDPAKLIATVKDMFKQPGCHKLTHKFDEALQTAAQIGSSTVTKVQNKHAQTPKPQMKPAAVLKAPTLGAGQKVYQAPFDLRKALKPKPPIPIPKTPKQKLVDNKSDKQFAVQKLPNAASKLVEVQGGPISISKTIKVHKDVVIKPAAMPKGPKAAPAQKRTQEKLTTIQEEYLLDELMDKELLEEIGELSSDEDTPKGVVAGTKMPLAKTEVIGNRTPVPQSTKDITPSANPITIDAIKAQKYIGMRVVKPKPNVEYAVAKVNNACENLNPPQCPVLAPNIVLLRPDYPQQNQVFMQGVEQVTYLVNPSPNLALYQTTQFAVPVVNQIIIGNATSVHNTDAMSTSATDVVDTVQNEEKTEKMPAIPEANAADNTNVVDVANNTDDKQKNKIEILEQKTLNFDYINRNKKRKVLHEVQEKENAPAPAITIKTEKPTVERLKQETVVEKKEKVIRKDSERVKIKRMAILNREINQRCYYPPIPLFYERLSFATAIVEPEVSMENVPSVTQNTNDNKGGLIKEVAKENAVNESAYRRILLRSSNKVKTPETLAKVAKTAGEKKPKAAPTTNATEGCNDDKTPTPKRVSKRNLNKKTVLNKTDEKTVLPEINAEVAKKNKALDFEDELLAVEIPNFKLTNKNEPKISPETKQCDKIGSGIKHTTDLNDKDNNIKASKGIVENTTPKEKVSDLKQSNADSEQSEEISRSNEKDKSEAHIPQPLITKRVQKTLMSPIDVDKCTTPLDYMKNVIINSVQIIPTKPGEPCKKCIQITLPNQKTYKVTVTGAVNVDIDTLFANPAVRTIITSNWSATKTYHLNIRHNPFRKVPLKVTNVTQSSNAVDVDTIDLISDEDIELKQDRALKTECGIYTIAAGIDIQKLQHDLNRKCTVKLIKHRDDTLSEKTSEIALEPCGVTEDISCTSGVTETNPEVPITHVVEQTVKITEGVVTEKTPTDVHKLPVSTTEKLSQLSDIMEDIVMEPDQGSKQAEEVISGILSNDVVQEMLKDNIIHKTKVDITEADKVCDEAVSREILQEVVINELKEEEILQSKDPAIPSNEDIVKNKLIASTNDVIDEEQLKVDVVKPGDNTVRYCDSLPGDVVLSGNADGGNNLTKVFVKEIETVKEIQTVKLEEPIKDKIIFSDDKEKGGDHYMSKEKEDVIVLDNKEIVIDCQAKINEETGKENVVIDQTTLEQDDDVVFVKEAIVCVDREKLTGVTVKESDASVDTAFVSEEKSGNTLPCEETSVEDHSVLDSDLIEDLVEKIINEDERSIVSVKESSSVNELDDSSSVLEVIEIDSSSSDEEFELDSLIPDIVSIPDISLPRTRTRLFVQPEEKINEFKNLLLNDLGVLINDTPNSFVPLTRTRNRLLSSKRTKQVDTISKDPKLSQDCFVKLVNCDDLVEKYKVPYNPAPKKCFIKLVKCDRLNEDQYSDSEIEFDVLSPNAEVDIICGSPSILNNIPWEDHDIGLVDDGEFFPSGKTSPVMEVFEIISRFHKKNQDDTRKASIVKCNAEWLTTKRPMYCNGHKLIMTSESPTSKSLVPSLLSMALNNLNQVPHLPASPSRKRPMYCNEHKLNVTSETQTAKSLVPSLLSISLDTLNQVPHLPASPSRKRKLTVTQEAVATKKCAKEEEGEYAKTSEIKEPLEDRNLTANKATCTQVIDLIVSNFKSLNQVEVMNPETKKHKRKKDLTNDSTKLVSSADMLRTPHAKESEIMTDSYDVFADLRHNDVSVNATANCQRLESETNEIKGSFECSEAMKVEKEMQELNTDIFAKDDQFISTENYVDGSLNLDIARDSLRDTSLSELHTKVESSTLIAKEPCPVLDNDDNISAQVITNTPFAIEITKQPENPESNMDEQSELPMTGDTIKEPSMPEQITDVLPLLCDVPICITEESSTLIKKTPCSDIGGNTENMPAQEITETRIASVKIKTIEDEYPKQNIETESEGLITSDNMEEPETTEPITNVLSATSDVPMCITEESSTLIKKTPFSDIGGNTESMPALETTETPIASEKTIEDEDPKQNIETKSEGLITSDNIEKPETTEPITDSLPATSDVPMYNTEEVSTLIKDTSCPDIAENIDNILVPETKESPIFSETTEENYPKHNIGKEIKVLVTSENTTEPEIGKLITDVTSVTSDVPMLSDDIEISVAQSVALSDGECKSTTSPCVGPMSSEVLGANEESKILETNEPLSEEHITVYDMERPETPVQVTEAFTTTQNVPNTAGIESPSGGTMPSAVLDPIVLETKPVAEETMKTDIMERPETPVQVTEVFATTQGVPDQSSNTAVIEESKTTEEITETPTAEMITNYIPEKDNVQAFEESITSEEVVMVSASISDVSISSELDLVGFESSADCESLDHLSETPTAVHVHTNEYTKNEAEPQAVTSIPVAQDEEVQEDIKDNLTQESIPFDMILPKETVLDTDDTYIEKGTIHATEETRELTVHKTTDALDVDQSVHDHENADLRCCATNDEISKPAELNEIIEVDHDYIQEEVVLDYINNQDDLNSVIIKDDSPLHHAADSPESPTPEPNLQYEQETSYVKMAVSVSVEVIKTDENCSFSDDENISNPVSQNIESSKPEIIRTDCENTELINNFHVITPQHTYKIARTNNNLKRKLSAEEAKQQAKKYRKGIRIDYPKLSAASIKESAFGSEYKALIDYNNTIQFSHSRPFLKNNEVDVHDALSNWPIAGPVVEMDEDVCDSDNLLYSDMPTKLVNEYESDPLNKSLLEELSTDLETETEIAASQDYKTNFSKGFGEESGRVIQNLKEGGDISKLSAATLSDVKHAQPFLLSSVDGENDAESRENTNHKKQKLIRSLNYVQLRDIALRENKDDQKDKLIRSINYIQMRDKVRSFFTKMNLDLVANTTPKHRRKGLIDADKFLRNVPGLNSTEFLKPKPTTHTINVVQVGQLQVSATAQNPVTNDPRVTQVSDASPSQCSVENSPSSDNSQAHIKVEYTELTNAHLSLPLAQDIPEKDQLATVKEEDLKEETVIPKEIEIRSELKERLDLSNEDPSLEPKEEDESMEFRYKNVVPNVSNDIPPDLLYNASTQPSEESFLPEVKDENGVEKIDQIAHAMNAAGIDTSPEPILRHHPLVNLLSQKVQPQATNNYQKTSITAMALQQALAQILPPPLNQTSGSDSGQQTPNTSHTPQVLHIVQGNNASGKQITLVDSGQQSVISSPNAAQVLHIVQNKSAAGTTSNGTSNAQNFSGLSLVDSGLQQGGNQLLHIVNTGNHKNANATGQLLKRVNLVTNLTNAQGGNEQKMVQFVCKSADGKSIHLNAPHQRSMVLRLQPIETPNVQANAAKPADQELSPTQASQDAANQEIKSRSVYEENYAKFIQNSSVPKPAVPIEKSTSLPKFNQAFGKATFQDGAPKQNDINANVHLTEDNGEALSAENTISLDHLNQINSPPLLVRKTAASTSQAQQNLVQQIKQSIAPMNMTMHGGVIYTRQIPVNIGGGQTINLITVPTTELIDENGQKQPGEMETPIIKIVPQGQPNSEGNTDDNNHLGSSSDNPQTPQPQQVLTQMRIKLPMLSKAPQVVQGARAVRPAFFQIQRNVISGANQGQVFQQLVLTSAQPLGQQTIRLPQAPARQIKVQQETQSPSESQLSTSTLEQLREFDMVLEQVKERSTVQPSGSVNNIAPLLNTTFAKLLTPSCTDATDGVGSVIATSTTTEHTQQILYSIGNSSTMNVAYVNRKATVTTPTTSTFVRSPDSSGIVDSPSSSSSHIPQTATETPPVATSSTPEPSSSTSSSTSHQPKAARVGHRSSKSRPKHTHAAPSTVTKVNPPIPPKTSTQKPQEDEQTTQRILYILAEYKEQVENSPDKDKPAPRRRSNPPMTPSGSSKRKKSSSGSRRHGCTRDHSCPRDHSPDDSRTMGSEDSSCGTSQGDCNESCSTDAHSPQESPRKVVRKLTYEQETPAVTQPRVQAPRNVIVADGQTITVARSATGKPTTAVLMPANYILPMSMMKGGQQIAIVTNRGPKLLTVGGPPGEAGAANALLLQRLIGPAGLKPMLARPGVRHVRLPATALHNLQAFNIQAIPTAQPPDSTASPAHAPTPPELVETRADASPWDPSTSEIKPDPGSSPENSEPWHLQASTDTPDYTYEEPGTPVVNERTVLQDAMPSRYSPDMEAQRIFDKMFEVEKKPSYISDGHHSPRHYDIDAPHSDCEEKSYLQVVQRKDGSHGVHRRAHISAAAALRHKYAILEHELRLQKSLSEECEDLGVDSPSASELFPEAELLFAASPAAHDHSHHTPQPPHQQSSIPQPELDEQMAADHLLPPAEEQHRLEEDVLGDVGIVTVAEDGSATIALDQEEFARAHPNTTFHSEVPTEDGEEVQPFALSSGLAKGRHTTIFHSSATATVLMTAPPHTVISQAPETSHAQNNTVKYDIDNMIDSLPSSHPHQLNLSSVLVKDEGLTRFDSILTDSRELHLSHTASAIVHPNVAQVIRRVCYDDDAKRDRDRFLLDENDGVIAGDDAKMAVAEESRDATMDALRRCHDEDSSPERHAELFWESNSASDRSLGRRPLDFSSDSDKCCKSPSLDETNSTDSSGVGTHLRLDSVIKEARGRERSGSVDGSSADDTTHPPIRTYPPKRSFHNEGVERSLSGKTRAGERSPDGPEVRRRASNRGVVKRGCHCCTGSPIPPKPKKPRQRKPTLDFTNSN